ncbi:MAG: transcription antitermination factor NusB, partial [Oscillospiraceae bacterium]|nr:transcription antitermination factor NusB [Oscillospiraceae bacterium]
IDDVPAGAAVNEAVELCKKYDEPSTAAFVNGVLSSFLKEEDLQ